MKFLARHRVITWAVAATMLAGALALAAGNRLANQPWLQAVYYNAGVQAYKDADVVKAIAFFDRSIAAGRAQQNASWLRRFIYPRPSYEYLALANFQKGKAMLQARHAEQTVQLFKKSIRLFNNALEDKHLSGKEARSIYIEKLFVQYDLELLFKARPDLAQQEGKGQGKKGNGNQESNKRGPGQDPGSQAGKGRPDDI